MGWTFQWVSSVGSDFNFDYYISSRPDQSATSEAIYNYAPRKTTMEELPGASVFYKDDDGAVFHTYSCYARGLDMLKGAYTWLDLTPKGRDETGPTRWYGCACATNTKGDARFSAGLSPGDQ